MIVVPSEKGLSLVRLRPLETMIMVRLIDLKLPDLRLEAMKTTSDSESDQVNNHLEEVSLNMNKDQMVLKTSEFEKLQNLKILDLNRLEMNRLVISLQDNSKLSDLKPLDSSHHDMRLRANSRPDPNHLVKTPPGVMAADLPKVQVHQMQAEEVGPHPEINSTSGHSYDLYTTILLKNI